MAEFAAMTDKNADKNADKNTGENDVIAIPPKAARLLTALACRRVCAATLDAIDIGGFRPNVMDILVLGGAVFLGRHFTDSALRAGHRVTHFNRGRSDPRPTPGVERLIGDRDRDLSALAGRRWDAVIDTCAYFPRQVTAAATALRGAARRYALVSSVNRYADFPHPGIDEDHPGEATPDDLAASSADPPLNAETYGFLKAACERALHAAWGEGGLVLRPGYLVGPYDRSHRFHYWVRRLAAGGRFLAPGIPDAPWQFIDVRDLTDWVIRLLEAPSSGFATFNVVGPASDSIAGDLLDRIAAATGGVARPTWVDADLLARSVEGSRWLDLADWSNLPDRHRFLYAVSNRRAVEAGLRIRPVAETVAAVLDHLSGRRIEPAAEALAPDVEAALLRALGQAD